MNQSFRTALKEGDEPAWVSRQKKVFTSWINLRIKGRDIAPVEDIFEDLKSGFVLYHLFEVLSGTSLRPLGKMNKNAKLRVQRVVLALQLRHAAKRRRDLLLRPLLHGAIGTL